MLLSKERYIARIFSVMLGYDIAEKLYNLNNKLYIKSGMLLDIRLPSLYHVLAPSSQGSDGGSGSDGGLIGRDQEAEQRDEGPAYQKSDPSQCHVEGPRKSTEDEAQHLQGGRQRHPWDSEPELPSGEDSTSLVLEDFGDVVGSLKEYGSERDYLR